MKVMIQKNNKQINNQTKYIQIYQNKDQSNSAQSMSKIEPRHDLRVVQKLANPMVSRFSKVRLIEDLNLFKAKLVISS